MRINVQDAAWLVPFAERLGTDFVWVHDAATVLEATLAHSLNTTGTPCLVVEMGIGQRINHKMCRRLVTGIFHLMQTMGMWHKNAETGLPRPIICKGDRVTFLNAETSGVSEQASSFILTEGHKRVRPLCVLFAMNVTTSQCHIVTLRF